MATRQGRAFWEKVIAEFETSGSTHREFAASRGLKLTTFQTWLYQIRKGSRVRAPRLLPVRIAGASITHSLEMAVAGVVLRVPIDADAERVAKWVSALEKRAC